MVLILVKLELPLLLLTNRDREAPRLLEIQAWAQATFLLCSQGGPILKQRKGRSMVLD